MADPIDDRRGLPLYLTEPNMFVTWLIPFFMALSGVAPGEAPRFEDHFLDKELRIDLMQLGTHGEERFCIQGLKEQPHYGGPLKNLIHDDSMGSHRLDLWDAKTGQRLYARGFCSLFEEWSTTAEARSGTWKAFEHCMVTPFPKKDVVLTLSRRKGDGPFTECFRRALTMDPRFIDTSGLHDILKTHRLMNGGDPHTCVDVVILGDGYQAKEMKDFVKDARKAADHLFSESPLKENRRRFNVWAVESPSIDSGVDEPRLGNYRNTALGTTFNTFDIARYSMTVEIRAVHDVAAAVPHDVILILFNAKRFGGGGILNLYAMVTGEDGGSRGVILHEFGHLFAGLGDEYWTSSVSYVDFYPDGMEPWEANLTALLDPQKLKWGKLIGKDIPVPTPGRSKYRDAVGCFEGGGYRAKGLYRPRFDCIMRSCRSGFCPVCAEAILREIRFHTDP